MQLLSTAAPLRVLVVSVALALAGCQSLAPDARFGAVEQAVEARTGAQTRWSRSEDDASSVRSRVAELLAKPLGSAEAVQIALINNPGLQASYAEVGIAEADLVQASRWRGPTFSFARLRRGDELEIERGVVFEILGLLTIPLSTRVSENRLAASQNRAAGEALRVAHEAKRAWVTAVAAEQAVTYAKQVEESAAAGGELARRMAAAGNWSALAQAREQAFHAEAVAQSARARQAAVAAKERLARLLGLASVSFRLPERLPDIPARLRDAGDLEAQALARRLDVQGARAETEALAQTLGLANATRYVDLVDFGLKSNSATGQPRQRGWEVDLTLPIFDLGGARTARAERQYQQAVNRTLEAAVNARSEVREADAALRSAWAVAKHYRDEVVPLRRKISEEMLLRYNGMLSSVFELLADSREQVAAVNAALEAQREYWLADADLQQALTGSSK